MGAQVFASATKAEICKCKECMSPGHQLNLPLAERQHEFHLFVAFFFPLSSKLVTNSWNLHNRRLLKTRALVIEMEKDAISHALGLNYGIISECIIEYLALRNHYHMLCINSGCSVSSGPMRGNANRMTFIHVIQHCAKNVPCWATGWGKNEYVFTLELYLHWTRKTNMSQSTRQMYRSTQAVLFVATAYCLRKANMRRQQVALEHRVSIHLRD